MNDFKDRCPKERESIKKIAISMLMHQFRNQNNITKKDLKDRAMQYVYPFNLLKQEFLEIIDRVYSKLK